uniref:Uncharacterized protein n=1 Tax=Romanomermis culicivorax TaxID=13658 RepID=A0A915K609_ROMCU
MEVSTGRLSLAHPVYSVNKTKILEKIATLEENPLLQLEKLVNIRNPAEHELGFCAQWLLDNMLVSPGRPYTYEAIDTSDINVMLNHNDVSESLKISPDGLEARCDTASFESVRSTFHVTHGVWYYEATIITSGIMQIGWATKESSFGNHDGSGIGDDEYSVSYDGCRQKLWHNAKNMSCNYRPWRSGDIFGTLLDLDEQKVSFFINGDLVAGPHTDVFKSARNSSGFFAAASFMAFQHCRFNFGGRKTPFAYPPPASYSSFNDFGKLNDDERRILPKPKMFELIQADLSDDACFVCCSEPGLVKLLPCGHSGYCGKCAQILQFCPQCRSQISSRLEV